LFSTDGGGEKQQCESYFLNEVAIFNLFCQIDHYSASNAGRHFRVSAFQVGSQLSISCTEIKILCLLQWLHLAILLSVKNQRAVLLKSRQGSYEGKNT